MHERDDHLLRHGGVAFFGRIVAAQSHEIINVLNTINELAGLQQDILAVAEEQRPLDHDKLRQTAEKIQAQVQRGQSIVRAVNRFAHSADRPRCLCDLKEILEQVSYLAQRAARLANTTLDQQYPEESLSLETNAFELEQAVYTCIETALAASSQVRRIDVSYQARPAGAEITVTSGDAVNATPDALEKQEYLELLVGELGGRVVASPAAGDGHRLTLFLPRQAPPPRPDAPDSDERRREGTNAG